MCLCVKSKSKSKAPQPQLERPVIGGSKIPKSTVVFNASDYQHKPFTSQSAFMQTKKVNKFNDDRPDRTSNYCGETNQAQKSHLLMPKQMLTYQLDGENGVSSTPVVNTFHYESVLSHCFVNPNQARVSRQGQSGYYENDASPYDSRGQNRNTKKSTISDRKSNDAIF